MKNILVSEDGTKITAIHESRMGLESWIRSVLQIERYSQEYLPDGFGIDVLNTFRSTTPENHFSESVRKTLIVHPEIKDCSVDVMKFPGGKLIAKIEIDSVYGTITLDQFHIMLR
jgi:hypothetical protein